MTDDLIVAGCCGGTLMLLLTACAVGWVGNHTTDIARSWADGRAQVVVWTQAVVTYALLWAAVVEPDPRGGAR